MERIYNEHAISVTEAFNELLVGDITHLDGRTFNIGQVRNVCYLMNIGNKKTYIDKPYVTTTKSKRGYITIRKRGV